MGKEIKRSYSKGLSRANLKILLTTIVTKPGDGMFEVATTHAPKATKTKTETKTKARKEKTTKTNVFHHGSENQKNKPIAPSGKSGESGKQINTQISSGDKAIMRKMSKKTKKAKMTKMTKKTRWKKMTETSNGRKGSESPRSSYRRQRNKKMTTNGFGPCNGVKSGQWRDRW